MGAIAEAMVEYAQPLIDQTDGSIEEVKKAMAISQACWNMALLTEEGREDCFSDIRSQFEMDEDEFDDFRHGVIDPMILRHRQMFPQLSQGGLVSHLRNWASEQAHSIRSMRSLTDTPAEAHVTPAERQVDIEPYAPCPCGSGRKYKFCCRKKAR